MSGIVKKSGTYTPSSSWAQNGVIVAGDAVATANRVTGVTIQVPRELQFRKLYIAGIVIPDYRTAYATGTEDARFVFAAKNDQTEFLRMEWSSPNSTGVAWPTSSNRVSDVGVMRPQFRLSSRLQAEPFMVGWGEPMINDGVEVAFRTQDAAPAPAAQEWLLSCAPFRFSAQVNELTINAERSTGVTPDQLLFWIGCLRFV
jgi:hypothetical protein